MRLVIHLTATVVFLLIAAPNVTSQTPERPENEIEVRGILSVPSGEASFTSSGAAGSVISFENDFDFRNELGFEIRFTHRTPNGKHKFQGSYGQTTWNRNRSLSRSFTFLGETFVANLDTSADLRLSNFRAMYAYRWGNEKIRIGPMGDMGVISTRLNITGTTNNGTRSGSGKITKFAATVGYDLDYDPTPHINIFNNLGAIAFQGERLFHVEGGIRVYATRNFGFSGGYKAERYRVEKDDDFLKVIAHGPFFGGIFRF
ncbi:MAG TPA: hypothetical protein VFS90_18815 [Pyrinomonadaceae bacterium]|nr:hypothetical protein [Pyrinomonadaceae bacterium]